MKEYTAWVHTAKGGNQAVIVRANSRFEAIAKLQKMGYGAILQVL